MFDDITKDFYLKRMELLLNKGIINKQITPFDDNFYEKLNHTYINGLPVSIHIKYLKPSFDLGKCFERSLYMFLSLDNAILVHGTNYNLELLYGKDLSGHGWVEIDDKVYDPTYMMTFNKDLYYKIFKPTNITKCNKEEYCSNKECQELYDDVKNTTLDDFKPYGRKRIELSMLLPLIIEIANNSKNQDFIDELNNYLNIIEYDEEEINNEINEGLQKILSNN